MSANPGINTWTDGGGNVHTGRPGGPFGGPPPWIHTTTDGSGVATTITSKLFVVSVNTQTRSFGCPGYVTTSVVETAATQANNQGRSSKGIPVGAVIGIVLGILLVFTCIALFLFYRRKRQKSEKAIGKGSSANMEQWISSSHAPSVVTSWQSGPTSITRGTVGTTRAPSVGPSISVFSDGGVSRTTEGHNGQLSSPSNTISTWDHQSSITAQSSGLEPIRKARINPVPSTTSNQSPSEDKDAEARETEPSVAGSSSPPNSPPMPVLVHEDSGLRMWSQSTPTVPAYALSEVPPMYTPR